MFVLRAFLIPHRNTMKGWRTLLKPFGKPSDPGSKRASKGKRIALGIIVLGVLLRLLPAFTGEVYRLPADLDEAQTLQIIQEIHRRDFLSAFKEKFFVDGPFYLLLLSWLTDPGSDLGARLKEGGRKLSLLFSLAGLLASGAYVYRYLPYPYNFVVLFFASTSPLLLFYTHQVRPYSLAFAFFWLALWVWGGTLFPSSWLRYLGAVILGLLSVATQLHTLIGFGLLGLYAFLYEFFFHKEKTSLSLSQKKKELFATGLALLILTIFGIAINPLGKHPYFYQGLHSLATLMEPSPLQQFSEQYFYHLWDIPSKDLPDFVKFFYLLFFLFVLWGYLRAMRARRVSKGILLLSSLGFLYPLILWIQNLLGLTFLYQVRHFIFLIPFAFLLPWVSLSSFPFLLRGILLLFLGISYSFCSLILVLYPIKYPHFSSLPFMERQARVLCVKAKKNQAEILVVDFLLWKEVFQEYCQGIYPSHRIEGLGHLPANQIQTYKDFGQLIRTQVRELLKMKKGIIVLSHWGERFFPHAPLSREELEHIAEEERVVIYNETCPIPFEILLCREVLHFDHTSSH